MQTLQLLLKKYAFLFVLLALSIFCRSYGLGGESIYGDEAYSIFYSQQSLKDLFPVFLYDQNPPLHMLLLHSWMNIFGISDVSAKAFSVVLSVLAGLILFVFSKRYLDKTTSVLVSILFLFSNAQQFFATEVRPYALIQFLCICSFYFYFRLLEKERKKDLFFLALINFLLLFSHYLTIYIFVVQFTGALFFFHRNRKGFWFYCLSQLLTVLAFLPWLRILLSNIPETGSFWNGAPGMGELRWHVNILNGHERLFYVFSAFIICSLIMFALNKRFRFYGVNFKARYYFIFLLLYLLPIVLDFYIAQFRPVFLSRYILYSTFGLFLFIAYVIGNLNASLPVRILTFIPLLYLVLATFEIQQEREDDWKSMVPLIKEQQSKQSVILVSASYKFREFAFYYDREAFKEYSKTLERLAAKGVYCSAKGEIYSWDKLNFDTVNKVIYVQSHSQFEDPEGRIREMIISKGFKPCDFYRKKNVAYSVFVRDSVDCHIIKETPQACITQSDGLVRTTGFMDGLVSPVLIFKTDTTKQGELKVINNKNEYGAGFSRTLKEIPGAKKVVVSGLVSGEKEDTGRLVFSLEKNGKSLLRNEVILSELRTGYSKKEKIFASFIIPGGQPQDAVLKIYFWNPGTTDLIVEELQVVIQ